MRNLRPESSVVQESGSGPGWVTTCTSSWPWDVLGKLNFGRIRIGIGLLIDEDDKSDDQVAQLLKDGHDMTSCAADASFRRARP